MFVDASISSPIHPKFHGSGNVDMDPERFSGNRKDFQLSTNIFRDLNKFHGSKNIFRDQKYFQGSKNIIRDLKTFSWIHKSFHVSTSIFIVPNEFS